MNKHTPGPWIVRPDLSIETGQSGITVAGLVDMPADARLIAAAPAMYAALQGMLDWARRVNTLNPGPEILNALNVIAQAEGRQ